MTDTSPPDQRSRVRRWLTGGLVTISAPSVALGLLGALPFAPFGDTWLSFAQFHAAVRWIEIGSGLLVLAAALVLLRRRGVAIVSAACALLLALSQIPGPVDRAARSPTGETVTIVSFNTMLGAGANGAFAAWLTSVNPDVVVFQEWMPDSGVRLAAALDRFPYRVEHLRDGIFGQAVFSKRPFVVTPELFPQGDLANSPRKTGVVGLADCQLRVRILAGGLPLTIQNLHLAPPLWPEWFYEQRKQIAWLGGWARARLTADPDEAMILLGDTNMSPATTHARQLRRAGLRDAHAAAGAGRGSTWCARGPESWLPMVRIDQAYVGGAVDVLETRVGPDAGSDHMPILIRLRVGAGK